MSEIGGIFQLFQIHGALYHRQGPLIPAVGMGDALYSQVYLYDPADAARARAARAPELDANLIRSLTMTLQESNPLIQMYLTAHERFAEIRAVEDNYDWLWKEGLISEGRTYQRQMKSP